MITIAPSAVATIPLPSFGKFTLRVHDDAGNENMVDVIKASGMVSIYGIIGTGISVTYGTTNADLTVRNDGAGVLYVTAFSQLTTLHVEI